MAARQPPRLRRLEEARRAVAALRALQPSNPQVSDLAAEIARLGAPAAGAAPGS